jgi:hypothetical protein
VVRSEGLGAGGLLSGLKNAAVNSTKRTRGPPGPLSVVSLVERRLWNGFVPVLPFDVGGQHGIHDLFKDIVKEPIHAIVGEIAQKLIRLGSLRHAADLDRIVPRGGRSTSVGPVRDGREGPR